MLSADFELSDEAAALQMAAVFASYKPDTAVVYLKGNLGTGKTTFSRGFIQSLGHTANVKSPTYTLIESYPLANGKVHHMDLYRLSDPEELEYLGIDELSRDGVSLIEWPEQGQGVIPEPDLSIALAYLEQGRKMHVTAHTPLAETWLQQVCSHTG